MQRTFQVHAPQASLVVAERIRQGLTLAQLKEAMGIEGATLARLENHEGANPTIGTLTPYADTVGKKVLVVLANSDGQID